MRALGLISYVFIFVLCIFLRYSSCYLNKSSVMKNDKTNAIANETT